MKIQAYVELIWHVWQNVHNEEACGVSIPWMHSNLWIVLYTPLLLALTACHFSFVYTAFEPPIIVTPPQPVVTAVTNDVQHKTTFNCTAVGFPTPHISWMHNMQDVSQNGRFQVMVTEDGRNHDSSLISSSTLTINSLNGADSGIVQCVADNGLGNVSADTTLSVLSKYFFVTRITE